MTYTEKLRDPRWQKKRLEILARDGWRCRACFRGDLELQVHHLVYRRLDPWAYDNECYQTLCKPCHDIRGTITDQIVDALRLALKNIPTPRLKIVAQRLCDAAMMEMGGG